MWGSDDFENGVEYRGKRELPFSSMSRPNRRCTAMRSRAFIWLAFATAIAQGVVVAVSGGAEPKTPQEIISLFNGKNLDGLTTWLKDARESDPRNVFQVEG